MKLISMVLRTAEPAAPRSVLHGTERLTWDELRGAVADTMRRLRRAGVRPGQRVLAIPEQDWRGLVLMAAASGIGARLLMPYNLSRTATREWLGIVRSARPDHVVLLGCSPEVRTTVAQECVPVVELHITAPVGGLTARSAAELREASRSDPVPGFLVLFTSGTTGAPKAICVSEAAICRRVQAVTERLSFTKSARIFMSGLINNTTGVIFGFGALLHGATLIYPEHQDVATWPQQVAEHRATHIMLRPVAMRRFLDAATEQRVDLSCLRVVAYGAAALAAGLLERGRAAIPCDWVQGYGLSETYGPFCWLDEAAHAEGRHRRGTYCVGRPDATVEVRLDPVPGHPPPAGEILLRSEILMAGYYDSATDEIQPPPEWFRTGDVGEWAEGGDLLLKGRIHSSILSENGHRIYPEELEAALADLGRTADVAVVGFRQPADPVTRVVAVVSGALADEPARAVAAVRRRLLATLSPEKWPDLVYPRRAALPTSVNQKVNRAQLAEQIDPAGLLPLSVPERT